MPCRRRFKRLRTTLRKRRHHITGRLRARLGPIDIASGTGLHCRELGHFAKPGLERQIRREVRDRLPQNQYALLPTIPVFFILFVTGVLALIMIANAFRLRSWLWCLPGFPLLCVIVFGGFWLFQDVCLAWTRRHTSRRLLRERLQAHGIPVCIRCGYDLRGQMQPRCPECGLDFAPELLAVRRYPDPARAPSTAGHRRPAI